MGGISRDELEGEFRSSPKEGMEALHVFFRDEIAGYIKCAGLGALDSNDISDIYQDVMVDLINATRKLDFDPTEPMRLVYRVAYTNTKDFLRKRGIRSAANLDDCLEHLAKDLKGTTVELRWRCMTADQQVAFNSALFDVICQLPEKQKITALAFITRYKETRDTDLFTEIANGVRESTGHDMTAAAAKGNWYRARPTIAAKLIDLGFDLYTPE